MTTEEMSIEAFRSAYAVAEECIGKTASDATILAIYQSVTSMSPKPDIVEVFEAISQFVDELPSDDFRRLITGREIRDIIRQSRGSGAIAALPSARVTPVSEATHEDARANRIALLRGVFNHQGDTKFYRGLLNQKGGMWEEILKHLPPVTHEDVMSSIENPVPGSKTHENAWSCLCCQDTGTITQRNVARYLKPILTSGRASLGEHLAALVEANEHGPSAPPIACTRSGCYTSAPPAVSDSAPGDMCQWIHDSVLAAYRGEA